MLFLPNLPATLYVIPATATAEANPLSITVSWSSITRSPHVDYTFHAMEIRRRPYGSTMPTLVGRITNPAVRSFTDTSITKGVLYEYMVSQLYSDSQGQLWVYNSQTWVSSGIEVPLEDSRGTALLLIDETVAPQLSPRIEVFRRNLIGDGWKVLVEQVPRDTNPVGSFGTPALTSDPRPTKQVITNTLAANPDLKAVVLIGRVTIPFSGNENPDFHGARAHATDAYYADINESWTDTIDHPSDLVPFNNPNDLRWDVKELENGRELMVGRIDFAGLTAFSESEVQLLDRYFNKNHAFRHGFLVADRRALWTVDSPLIDATISNMISYFGNSRVTGFAQNSWSTVTANQSYLWGAAGSTGSSSATAGISTANMAVSDYKVVFATAGASSMMQVWNNNSAVRALIAMPTWGIASMASHGYYGSSTFPAFSMGRLIGELNLGPTTRYPESLPQRTGMFGYAQRALFANLQGDPTVAMYATLPPSNLRVTATSGTQLQWNPSSAPNLVGYHIYRSSNWNMPFTRLTSSPVSGTTYTDSTARTSDVIYMVRAVSLENRGTGTYFSASQGVMAPLSLSGVSSTRPVATPASFQPIEDTPLPLTLSGADAEGDPLQVIIVRPPTNGKLVGVGANLTYHPYPNYTGTDSFEFVVNDGFQDSAPATVTLQVQPVNDLPVATALTATVRSYRGVATEIALRGTDVENSPLTFRLGTPPARGVASISGPILSYLPEPGYTGADSFTIIANDGTNDSLPATAAITVTSDLDLAGTRLRGWWRFDDAAGSTAAADSNPSPTKFNAALQGSASISAIGGISGGALQIPSTGSRARITGQIYTGFVSAGSTSVWFRAQDVANNTRNQIIATMGSTNGRNWNAHLRNGELRVHFRFSTSSTFNNDTLVVPGIQNDTWYHLVVSYQMESTRASHGVQIFLNGRSVGWLAGEQFYRLEQPHGFGNAVGPTAFPGAAMTGSTTTPPDAWFNGQIDEARHYSTPLRGPEVVALYHLGQPPAPNQPPVANIQATPEPGGQPLRIAWSGAASSDPDGTIYSYRWLFGDGSIANGPEVVVNYSQAGSYGATLTVTDNEGAQTSTNVTVDLGSTSATAPRGTPVTWLTSMFGPHGDSAALELLDHDGDQQSAWIEYRAGTNPSDPGDSFRITHIQENANGSRTLRWRASNAHGANATFRVLTSPDLSPGSWSPLSSPLQPSSSPEMEWTTPVQTGNRFYRIQID